MRTLLLLALYMATLALALDAQSTELMEHHHEDEHDLVDDGVMIRCRSCGAPVAFKKDFMHLHDTSKAVGSRHEPSLEDAELFTFVNPSRAEFELAGFKKVLGMEGEAFSKKATVFDDYSWRDIRCSSCKRHIGWAFYHDELQQCINTQLVQSISTRRAKDKLLASTAEMERKAEIVRKELEGHCIFAVAGWWTYEVCYKQEVRQFHQEPDGTRPSDWSMGVYVPDGPEKDSAYAGTDVVQYFAGGQHCDENGELRSTKVVFTCCKSRPTSVSVEKIDEPALCSYLINVCVPSLCETEQEETQDAAENAQIVEACKAEFDATHTVQSEAPPSFSTLRWATVVSEDSSELDWARRMQFTD